MRTLLALTCCLALTAVVRAEDQDNNKQDKKNKKQATLNTTNAAQSRRFQTLSNASRRVATPSPSPHYSSSGASYLKNVNAPGNNKFNAGSAVSGQTNAQFRSKQKTWVVQNFKLQKNTQISPVRFQANAHIVGSQNWK